MLHIQMLTDIDRGRQCCTQERQSFLDNLNQIHWLAVLFGFSAERQYLLDQIPCTAAGHHNMAQVFPGGMLRAELQLDQLGIAHHRR